MSRILLLFVALMVSFSSQGAALYQFNVGMNWWQQDFNVTTGEVVTDTVSLQQDDVQKELVFGLEHPFLLLPNVKIATSDHSASGQELLTQTFILSGQTYKVASDLAFDYQFDQTNYTLYYEMFDNQLLEFDIGVTFKSIDTQLTALNTLLPTEKSTRKASGIESYLHSAGKVNLPLLNLSFAAELNAQSEDNFDAQVAILYKLSWIPILQPQIQLGWKKQKLDLDDFDSLYIEHSWESVFAGVKLAF